MKKLIIGIVLSFLFSPLLSQDNKALKKEQENAIVIPSYCAMLKDGKIILTNDGKEVYEDIKLSNGTRITVESQVIKKDGTRTWLKSGDCVDQEGNIIILKNNHDQQKEKSGK